jgi:hypothetical protein
MKIKSEKFLIINVKGSILNAYFYVRLGGMLHYVCLGLYLNKTFKSIREGWVARKILKHKYKF